MIKAIVPCAKTQTPGENRESDASSEITNRREIAGGLVRNGGINLISGEKNMNRGIEEKIYKYICNI